MHNAKLTIQQHTINEPYAQLFTLIGNIDSDSQPALRNLYTLPSNTTTELNFSQVNRMNSIGLAELLKLIEHLQKNNITVRITSANQTIGLMFNQTGLTHLLNQDCPNASTAQPTTPNATAMLQLVFPQDRQASSQRIQLIGIIDASAAETFLPLYQIPKQSHIELDFSNVERINSMGLAQLLQLFEHWQKQQISIQVSHLNRMISVLFKMTGLTRFISDAAATNSTTLATTAQTPAFTPTSTADKVPHYVIQTPTLPPLHTAHHLALAAHAAQSAQPAHQLTQEHGLQIKTVHQTEPNTHHFELIGIIDATALPCLQSLWAVPPYTTAQLNFAQVLRVNSMGLAQLLKLFEYWQEQHIQIQIINTNRMIGILFKMTGLTRFLANNIEAAPTAPTPQHRAQTAAPTTGYSAPQHTLTPPIAALNSEKLNVWINAQSSQHIQAWQFFSTYLQQHLGRTFNLELIHGTATEHPKAIETMDIVYTNPFVAAQLQLTHHFQPCQRPLNQFEEVTVLIRADDTRQTLEDFQHSTCATTSANTTVYLQGRVILEEHPCNANTLNYVLTGHDIKALQLLLKGKADILFMLSQTYQSLSSLSKKSLRILGQSDTQCAYPMFLTAPQSMHLNTALHDVLLNMGLNSQGRQALAELGFSGWSKPSHEECAQLTQLYTRFNAHKTS